MNTQQIVGKQVTAGAQNVAGVTVAIIAWKCNGYIGFDRYESPSVADRMLEIQHGFDLERGRRQASCRMDVVVSCVDTADVEIDAQLEDLLRNAQVLH